MPRGTDQTIAALDVGRVRIGVALARLPAALPSPYGVVINDANVWQALQNLVDQEGVTTFVVGLPRGMAGQETAQTKEVRIFVRELKKKFPLPVHLQDEALTSKKAEAELATHHSRYNKEMVDALAATYILEDYLHSLNGVINA